MPPDEATTPASTVLEAAPLFTLATRPKSEPHKLGPSWRTEHCELEQIERACTVCGLVRITVFPPALCRAGSEAFREYRYGSEPQFMADREPECVPVGTDMGCRS